MVTEDEARTLDAQAEATLDVVRAAVIRLLLDGQVRPQLVALGVAQVAGELGASVAVADGLALERVLDELIGFMRRAGRKHHDLVRDEEAPPAAGSAQQAPRILPSLIVDGSSGPRDGKRRKSLGG